MARIFRAFMWMRWRVLMNSLERTGARDTLERFSVAAEKLGPIITLVLLIPSSIALLVAGMAAGFGLGTGQWVFTIELLRYLLLLALVLTIVGPIILPSRDSGAIIRLLLLPIPRVGLYVGQMAGAIADPWIILVVPMVLGVAIGLAVALKFFAALVALLAGIAFLLFVMGLTSLASSIVHILLRDRRRGEVVMFIVVLIIPFLAMAPQMLLRPEEYSVIATPNLNGDYLSDAAAAQVGGLGMAPGGNVGDGLAVFEATHGTAPKYANLDRINPGSVILSGVMMFEYLGWNEVSTMIVKGIEEAIRQKHVTYDLARQMPGSTEVSTSKFADRIIAGLKA